MFRAHLFDADAVHEIKEKVKALLITEYSDLLPREPGARILLKPNLNAHMNALTGNTTDLRLLAAVLETLKGHGYTNITLAEGTNSGFYRNKISVISRLHVDTLASHYGVKIQDLNYSEPVPVSFEKGVKAGVARECLEADLFINMPKLKTHFEAGMSVCLKNLMGCLVGQENKKKTHQALAQNILHIHEAARPHLHIVDALIAMEGLGPTRGTPIKTRRVFMGTDPFILDLLCARFASMPWSQVRTLAAAQERGLITESHHAFVEAFPLERSVAFKPPKAGLIAGFVHSPKRQKYFLAIRNTSLFARLCSTQLAGKLLFASGLRQDVFHDQEMRLEGLRRDPERCTGCGRCAGYCPLGLQLPEALPSRTGVCLDCLYCFLVCPEKAIQFQGDQGFLSEQLRQYDEIVRRVT